MDAQTLANAWQPITHTSPLVADSWQLGEYLIVRLTGSASYDLFGVDGFRSLAVGGLEELKDEGARRWAFDIAKAFTKQQIAPMEESEGDVRVEDHGSIALFRPRSEAARDWIKLHVQEDAQWMGDALVVEPRFSSYMIEGMVEAGLRFG